MLPSYTFLPYRVVHYLVVWRVMPKQRGLYDHTIWIVLKEKETNKDNYYKKKSYGKVRMRKQSK